MEDNSGKSELLASCDRRFHKYIRKVLNRLSQEVRQEELLDDPGFKIVSFDGEGALGTYTHFTPPINHLVILNDSLLSKPELHIVHTIAHEFAHKVAWKSETGLHEMDAEAMLREWGFQEESDTVGYRQPIWENEGFKVGYEWAGKNDLTEYEVYYDEWNENRLTSKRWEALHYLANIENILGEMGRTFKSESSENTEPPEGTIADTSGTLDRAIIIGIMQCLREKKEQSLEKASESDLRKAQFFEQFKRIFLEMTKLVDMDGVQDYIMKLPDLRAAYMEIGDFLEGADGEAENQGRSS